MFWWAVLAYVLFSPLMGLVIGGGIRMLGADGHADAIEQSPVRPPCPAAGQRRAVAASSAVLRG